ncbi:MAG TPA: ACT domain-containing protein, partial [Methanothrix sp.]|nr:ACT domain-containing protein [Methanothrix sp.]
MSNDLWVISFIGRDRPGLIRDVLEQPARENVNIVDMDQRVMQGIFVMSVVADFTNASVTAEELQSWLTARSGELDIQFSFLPLQEYKGRRRSKKRLYAVTILARDRVGIIRDMADVAAANDINIERASVTARGDLISIEFLMDFADCDDNDCKFKLKKDCEKKNLDIVIQELGRARKEKRLIVFDMDMTIVDFEIINKLAGFAGVD